MKPSIGLAGLAGMVFCMAGGAAAAGLPLKPGIYVDEGTSCDDPANAVIRSIDAQGALHSAHELGCRQTIAAQGGSRYTLHEECAVVQLGSQPGKPYVADDDIRVLSATRFQFERRLEDGKIDATRYRLCPGLKE